MSTAGRDLAAWPEPLPVKEWMTAPVITIVADASARDAARVMKTRRVRHLPVLSAEGRVIGILTDRDLRQVIFDPSIQERLQLSPDTLDRVCVRDVMTWSVITAKPDLDIRIAARLMHEQKIGALPVVAEHKLVGMLTEHDLLRAFQQLVVPRVRRPRPLRSATFGEPYDYGFPVPSGGEGAGGNSTK